MKKSSIEWLVSEIEQLDKIKDPRLKAIKTHEIFQQAKQMHKRELKRCCMETMETCQIDMIELGLKTMDDYFNFIYKKTLELDETRTN